MKKKTAQKPTVATSSFETTVEVCCHQVSLTYWNSDTELTDELEAALTEEGKSRAQECIIDGCNSGDLNYLHVDANGKDKEIRGWWEIEND